MKKLESSRLSSVDTNQVFLYFGTLTFLLGIVNPTNYFTDISTSYMLKNQLHMSAEQISGFRLLTLIPVYLAFFFGLIRDRWNPLGIRDRGLFLIFGPITALVFVWLAFQEVTLLGIFTGVMLVVLSTRLIMAAYQGLISLVGQEKLMAGRLATVWQSVYYVPIAISSWLSGLATVNLTPKATFLALAVCSAGVGALGLWKPKQVFTGAYDSPEAKNLDFWSDVRRLLKHKAIYAPVLIMFLWNFAPGSQTPLQFYLTNTLHASDAAYANFNAIFTISFLPTFFVYGYLCTRYPLKKLLYWSTIVAVPQLVPLLFVRSALGAELLAIPIGLMGGAATAAYYDLAMRSCPPGLQGTLMLMVDGVYWLCQRGGDWLGSKIYDSDPKNGFTYCVIAITVVYALILPCIKLAPKHIVATADGERSEEYEHERDAELGLASRT
jgi:hypothetical protein